MVLPTDPQTPIFPAGYGPLPADFDGWVQTPLSFLTGKVVFRGELSTATTWTNSANTLIPFNTIDEDPYSGWSSGSHSWTCPAGCSGTYVVTMTVSAAPSADTTTSMRAVVDLNSNSLWTIAEGQTSSSQNNLTCGSVPVQLYGGQDVLTFFTFWTSSANGAAVTTSGQRTTAEVTWFSF